MSIEFLKDKDTNGHVCKWLVGKHCLYCMDCGRIGLEYKNKKDFMKLMNPYVKDEATE